MEPVLSLGLLPYEVHLELSCYLGVTHLTNLSHTSSNLYNIFNPLKWRSIRVISHIPSPKPTRYSAETDVSSPADVPYAVYSNPQRYSWFYNENVVSLSADNFQKQPTSNFIAKYYPKIKRFTYDRIVISPKRHVNILNYDGEHFYVLHNIFTLGKSYPVTEDLAKVIPISISLPSGKLLQLDQITSIRTDDYRSSLLKILENIHRFPNLQQCHAELSVYEHGSSHFISSDLTALENFAGDFHGFHLTVSATHTNNLPDVDYYLAMPPKRETQQKDIPAVATLQFAEYSWKFDFFRLYTFSNSRALMYYGYVPITQLNLDKLTFLRISSEDFTLGNISTLSRYLKDTKTLSKVSLGCANVVPLTRSTCSIFLFFRRLEEMHAYSIKTSMDAREIFLNTSSKSLDNLQPHKISEIADVLADMVAYPRSDPNDALYYRPEDYDDESGAYFGEDTFVIDYYDLTYEERTSASPSLDTLNEIRFLLDERSLIRTLEMLYTDLLQMDSLRYLDINICRHASSYYSPALRRLCEQHEGLQQVHIQSEGGLFSTKSRHMWTEHLEKYASSFAEFWGREAASAAATAAAQPLCGAFEDYFGPVRYYLAAPMLPYTSYFHEGSDDDEHWAYLHALVDIAKKRRFTTDLFDPLEIGLPALDGHIMSPKFDGWM